MIIRWRSPNQRLTVEVDAENIKAALEELSVAQELCSEQTCGCCGSEDLRFAVRDAQSNTGTFKYYEMVCNNQECGAKLSFGQRKDGGMWIKRDGEHRGWAIYRGRGGGGSPDDGPGPSEYDDSDIPF